MYRRVCIRVSGLFVDIRTGRRIDIGIGMCTDMGLVQTWFIGSVAGVAAWIEDASAVVAAQQALLGMEDGQAYVTISGNVA